MSKKKTWDQFSIDTIKHYLNGQTDKTSSRRIEKEMNNSSFFSDAIDGFSESPDALDIARELSFDTIRSKKKKKTIPLYSRIASAAAVLLLPLAALIWWNNNSNQGEQIFAANYTPFPTDQVEVTRSDNPYAANKTITPLLLAYKAYSKNNHPEAIKHFEQTLTMFPEEVEATFYLGLSHLELGQTDAAINYLETARINGERFYEDATWYLALAQVKAAQPKEAQLVLQDLIKNEKGHYFQQAKSLLKQLD